MSISMTKRSFLTWYTLYIFVFAWGVGLTLGMGFPSYYFDWYPFIPIFFYLFGWFYIYMFDACRIYAPNKRQLVYLGMKAIKMILSISILLFYSVKIEKHKTAFFLIFFLFYLLSMIFESSFFIKFEKNRKIQVKDKKTTDE